MAYVTYIAKREIEPTGFSKTGTDFSAIGSDDSFNAATTNLSGLLTDQWLQAAGFVKNAGWFQVKSNSTSGKILTNTPPVTHLRMPGVDGNYASTPDSAAASVTGDIDLRAQVAMNDWTPPTSSILIDKSNPGANQASYAFYLNATGNLVLELSQTGAAGGFATSSVATGLPDGARKWVRATWRTSDGRVQFFTSDDGIAWTQLGTDQTIALASIFNSTTALTFARNGQLTIAGRYYYAEVRNGIGGPVVAAFDPSRGTRGAGSLVALTGETWTINTSGTPPALLQGPLLTYEGAEYMAPSSGSSWFATSPDSAAASVTGSIELTVKVRYASYTPAVLSGILEKDDGVTNRDYNLYLATDGKLHFLYSSDGSTITGRDAASTVAVPFAANADAWFKATYNSGTGVVQFFTSTDGVTFTQLGTNVTITSGAIHDGTGGLAVGSTNFPASRVYYAEVRNGIGGPVVVSFDPGRAAAGAATLVAYTGETWTLGGAAALVRTTPVTITGYKRGFGQSYSLEFKAEKVDRSEDVKRSMQQPIGGGAPEVLNYRSEVYVDVLTEILDEATQVPQVREFLASVQAGEVFTFDRYGTVAAPVDPRQAMLSSEKYAEQRVMTSLRQRIPFQVRLLT